MYKTVHNFVNYILRILAPYSKRVTENRWVLYPVVGVNVLNCGDENERNLEENA
jgi:hypothetical protein